MMGLFSAVFGNSGEVKEMLQNGAVIVDVRTVAEFRQAHIKGAVNIPLDGLERKLSKLKKTGKPIVLCCASGSRSHLATTILKRHGIRCCNGGSWLSVKKCMHEKTSP